MHLSVERPAAKKLYVIQICTNMYTNIDEWCFFRLFRNLVADVF